MFSIRFPAGADVSCEAGIGGDEGLEHERVWCIDSSGSGPRMGYLAGGGPLLVAADGVEEFGFRSASCSAFCRGDTVQYATSYWA